MNILQNKSKCPLCTESEHGNIWEGNAKWQEQEWARGREFVDKIRIYALKRVLEMNDKVPTDGQE